MLQMLAMGTHPKVLQKGAAMPKVWHTSTWSGRKGRGEPVPYPQGTSLPMRCVWGQTYGMGKGMPRRSPGMAKSKRGVYQYRPRSFEPLPQRRPGTVQPAQPSTPRPPATPRPPVQHRPSEPQHYSDEEDNDGFQV